MAPKRKNSVAPQDLPLSGPECQGLQDPKQPLTEMQRLFVHHFVNDKLNQTAAARMAGFEGPGVAAHSLMRNPKIIAAIEAERLEYAKASGMTKQRVIDGFSEAIDMARVMSDPIAMISGWREIGKMCGFYEPTKTKIEVSLQGRVLIERMQTMSDAELIELAAGDPTALEGEFHVVDESQSP